MEQIPPVLFVNSDLGKLVSTMGVSPATLAGPSSGETLRGTSCPCVKQITDVSSLQQSGSSVPHADMKSV